MAATQLAIINEVQRRLREDETASVGTTDYSTLLGDLLNDTISELNEAHDWLHLRSDEVTSVIGASTRVLDLSASTSNESRISMRPDGTPEAYMFDDSGTDDTATQLRYMHPLQLDAWYQANRGVEGIPTHFTLVPQNDADGLELQFPNALSESRTFRMRFWTPQARLDTTGTDDATVVYFDTSLLVLGTLYRAQNERGEEMGEPNGVTERRYRETLAEAIYRDMNLRGVTNEYEFVSD